MRADIQKMLDLQELEIVAAESRIVHRKSAHAGRDALDGRIGRLRAQIPEDLLKRYDKLRRGGFAVATESDGVCSGCRMNIPKGDLNRMQNGAIPWVCPNCARFLLLSERN
jgi:predicted  nucleic acid-binding Zn-ribbon protein